MQKSERKSRPEYLVCFGASAGGLGAFRRLVPALNNPAASYVYCQHLSPSHESQLAEIIARDSALRVETVTSDLVIESGCLYVVPPNHNIAINKDSFILSPPVEGPFPKPSINKFFSSAADAFSDRLIAVVLSGSGSDGALGVVRVRSRGGVVLVQAPESSEFKGMPEAVINIHAADSICPLENLAETINRIIENKDHKVAQMLPETSGDAYRQIIDFISTKGNHNLREYRESTISRRIHRRMSIRGVQDIYAYYQLLQDDPDELGNFINDAFIIVSQFYRDSTQFDELRSYLSEALVNKSSEKTFRIWVPACATGEEAYTLAMLLTTIKRELNLHLPVKIMASDISHQAIESARSAEYLPDKLVSLPVSWKEEFFDRKGEHYVVKSAIREMVLFSVHNVLADPPFSKLNLISCRNLLIYFNQDLQQKLLGIFHYSLNYDGLLFLGASETVGKDGRFVETSPKSKLFARRESASDSTKLPAFLFSNTRADNIDRKSRKATDIEKNVYRSLLEMQGLSAVVLDGKNALAFTIGNYFPLFSNQGMFVSENALDMLATNIRACCRAMVYKLRRKGAARDSFSTQLQIDGNQYKVSISVSLLGPNLPDWVVLAFKKLHKIKSEQEESKPATKASHVQAMEQELSATRENLQTVIEELETSNEQLALYNEELQVANEEFRSTNEELQTVIEELQSTNEELMTVNDEFNQKSIQQARLSADLNNIQESLALPVIVVNKDFRIQRLTNSCSMILDVDKIKENDLFIALQWYIEIPDLKVLMEQVKDSQEPRKTEIILAAKTYECQISPYRNSDNEFDGYTIIFVDTTQLKRIQDELAREKLVAQTTLETITEGVIRVNSKLEVEFINPVALSILRRDADDMLGKCLSSRLRLFNDKGEPIKVSHLFEKADHRYKCEVEHGPTLMSLCTQYGETIQVEFTTSSLRKMSGYVLTFRDVTERQTQLKSLRWQSQHDSLTGLINRAEIEQRLARAIAAAGADKKPSALLYLDLDQFKIINDQCGHLAGDKLLQQLSQVLSDNIRSRDTLARLGGDEFALLLEHCRLEEAHIMAKKIQEKVRGFRFIYEERVFRVGVSIGLVCIDETSGSVSDVLSHADAACYSAKESGRNSIKVYNKREELREKQRQQVDRVAEVNAAIENNMFRLYFQDIQKSHDQGVVSWEVLLRMLNAKGEFLQPMSFLPAAERFGLSKLIDTWVLENALANIRKVIPVGCDKPCPQISINLSGATVAEIGYVDLLAGLLDVHQFPAKNITFEISESVAVANLPSAKRFIKAIRDLGCRCAIDNFGANMGSLSYLRELGVDQVKIDASFVSHIDDDDISSVIVSSVIEVAKRLSVEVVAEGVESDSQLCELKGLGLSMVQGYHLGKPRPFEEFIAS